jgi:hypothetical protein
MDSWSATAEKRQWPSGLIYRVSESDGMSKAEGTGRAGTTETSVRVRTSCISSPSSLHILLIARSSSLASRSSLASASALMGGCFSASAAAFLSFP